MTRKPRKSDRNVMGGLQFRDIVRTLVLSIIFVLIGGECVMANDFDNGFMKLGAFSISESGGLEYGSRQMSFDGENKFYFAKGDTINDETQTGVGVFVLNLQDSDVQQLKGVARVLCDRDIQTGGPETHDPAATFSVACLNEDKVVQKSGSLRLIPDRFRHQVFSVPLRLSEQARTDGRKIIKLDFTTVSIGRKSDNYVVAVRFINSGSRWIKFKTPDQWNGTSLGGRLGVGAIAKNNQNGEVDEVRRSWAFGLGGKKLINGSEFPDGVVKLNPGEAKILKFEAAPDYKAEKGDYEFSGVVFMRIEYDGYGWGLSSQVDFKPIKSHVTFDQGYPSTPLEREQWETTHRVTMSSQPVKPGTTFAEDGLYRAVRLTSGGYRSLQLTPFKAGDVATTSDVKMPMESGHGIDINGPVQWIWEGSAPIRTSEYSTEYVDGTQHVCGVGTCCPRSGRWVARIRIEDVSFVPQYRYDTTQIVTMRRDQKMPSIRTNARDADWEWVGA